MKIFTLIFLLLISVSSIGAVDKPTALPFTGRNTQYQRIPRLQKKQPKKKYPLWLKIGAGVAVVTTTAIVGGLIWNWYHAFEFDGPWSCVLATFMNVGLVLGKIGIKEKTIEHLRKPFFPDSLLFDWLEVAAGTGSTIPFNSDHFYKGFQSFYSAGIELKRGVTHFANMPNS